jgi:hypothetical protein
VGYNLVRRIRREVRTIEITPLDNHYKPSNKAARIILAFGARRMSKTCSLISQAKAPIGVKTERSIVGTAAQHSPISGCYLIVCDIEVIRSRQWPLKNLFTPPSTDQPPRNPREHHV